jgi:three-Cys-motif partner protein
MSDLIEPRKTQSKVKHVILEQYLKTWGGIIINALQDKAKKSSKFNIHLVYVDCFSSVGRYSGDSVDIASGKVPKPIFGSPIIGILGLDLLTSWAYKKYGINVIKNSILIEKTPKRFDELIQTLKSTDLLNRVKNTNDFSSLDDGEIAIIQGDANKLVSSLIDYTQKDFKFSLYLLDPYGPKGIPYSFVSPIVNKPRHDVMINMPYQDLHKKSGLLFRKKTKTREKLVKNYDEMFGPMEKEWQDIVYQLEAEAMLEEQNQYYFEEKTTDEIRKETATKLEIELIDCYRDTLLLADPTLTVKSVGLRFPDKERTMYYLYLTTHDPNGALAINEIIWEANYLEHELRWKYKEVIHRKQQLPLFEMPTPPFQSSSRPDVEEIANEIFTRLQDQKLTRREIYRLFAEEHYFATEINKALTQLKRKGKAKYDSKNLTNDSVIEIC